MLIFRKTGDLQAFLQEKRNNGALLGFVPTMGALHAGHTSLLEKARKNGDFTVVSIFVNPTQFNDKKDFDAYPMTIDDDIALLQASGCDVVFIPSVDEIYPSESPAQPVYDFGYLDTILEGAHRPGHFKGVGQVVARLLHIVQPHHLYMGQKDYQQCMVISNLLMQMPDMHTQMVMGDTVREQDGLAMSSRNRRLTEPQRAIANLLYQCLVSIQAKAGVQDFSIVQKECLDILRDKGFEPEYVMLADASSLQLLENYDNNRKMVALIAARIGNVRLIDNLLVNS